MLEGILFDAHAAYLSEQDSFQQTRTVTGLREFLKDYQQRHSTTTESALAAQLSLEDVVGVIRFHRSIIELLTERYAAWALDGLYSSPLVTQRKSSFSCSFTDQDMWSSLPAAVRAVLTHRAGITGPTERRRIQRGMHRFEIFCNVVGSKGQGRSSPHYIGEPPSSGWEEDYVEQLYVLALFPAWQAEEMLCIYEFMKDVYRGVFAQGAWDSDEARNPEARHFRWPLPNINPGFLYYGGEWI
ncbi:hypothetical protein C8A03DRAFT_38695 [Achaetomium macrosporum]|uniref:Uncharacterized protein n=1 Tax=Achaetomium macrosporum TaxID=79813 RepID=A0AAN7C1K0_9PEZI|nr:hypothetical protein C8A03DRAFT_38695 [Achaetomium macrosporum]